MLSLSQWLFPNNCGSLGNLLMDWHVELFWSHAIPKGSCQHENTINDFVAPMGHEMKLNIFRIIVFVIIIFFMKSREWSNNRNEKQNCDRHPCDVSMRYHHSTLLFRARHSVKGDLTMRNVYTYFQPVLIFWNDTTILDVWMASCRNKYLDPIILNESHDTQHTDFGH